MENQLLDDNPEFRARTELDFAKIAMLKKERKEHRKHIQNGRVALYVLAVLSILGVGLAALQDDEIDLADALIEGVILIILYVGAAIYSNQKPHIGITAGLVVFLLMQMLSAFIDPSILIKGIIVKVIILYYLGKATAASFDVKKTNEDLLALGEK